MAYYNPNNNDDRYYNPHNNTNNSTSTFAQGVGSFVKNAVGYMVLQSAVSIAGGAISKRVGSAVQSIAKHSGSKSSFAKYITNVKTPSIKHIIRGVTPFRKALNSISRAQRPYKNAYVKRARYLRDLKKRDPLAANKARLTSIFKDRRTTTAVLGNTVLKHAIKGSMVGYAWDSMSGQLPMYNLENKPIWDVPGHVMNYAKYMKQNVVAFTAFGSIGGMFEAGKGAIGVGIRNVFNKNKGLTEAAKKSLSALSAPRYSPFQGRNLGKGVENIFTKEVHSFQSSMDKNLFTKAIRNTKAVVGTAYQEMIVNARGYFNQAHKHVKAAVGHNTTSGTKTKGNAFIDSVLGNIRQTWKDQKAKARLGRSRSQYEIPGMSLIHTFEEIAATAHNAHGNPISNSAAGASGQHFLNAIASFNDQIKPKSFIASVLGLKPTKIGDVVNTDVIGRIAERTAQYFPDGKSHLIKDALSNSLMGKQFYGKGKFATDLSKFSPMHQLKRLTNKLIGVNLSLLVGIPPIGRDFSLGNITGLNSVLSDEVKATMFRSNTTGFGLIADSGGVLDGAGGFKIKPGSPRTLKQIMKDSVGDEAVLNRDVGISFIGGKFYAVDGVNVTPLNTRETVLKFSHSSIFGQGGEAKKANIRRWQYHNNKDDEAMFQMQKMLKGAQRATSNNPFKGILQKLDWHVPKGISRGWKRVQKALMPGRIHSNGKRFSYDEELYAQAVEGIMLKDIHGDKLHGHISTLKDMMYHTNQEVGTLLRRPTVFNELAERSKKSLGVNFDSSSMYSDETFMTRMRMHYRSVDDVFDGVMANPEMKQIYETALHYQSKAREHLVFKRNGRLSNYSAMDLIKTQYVTESINAKWTPAQGLHPMIETAEYLQKKGILTDSESRAMKLQGFISTLFKDAKLDQMLNSDGPATDGMRKLIKKTTDTYKTAHNVELQDVMNYISDTDLRAPVQSKQLFKRFRNSMYDSFKVKSMYEDTYDTSPFFTLSVGANGQGKYTSGLWKALDIGTERLTNMINDLTGLKKDPFKYGNGALGSLKFIGTRGLQVAGAVAGYKAIDSLVAGNPLFDETAFDSGVTGFVADNIAKTHLLSSKLANVTGVAGVGRYLDGLMPGFNSSAPGAVVGGALNWKGGLLNTLGGAFKGAIGNRVLSPLMPDYTKTYDQLKAEYAGEEEVPIMEGKYWFLGNTPWQGKKIKGWEPNWYVQSKSRWEATDTLYGSEFRKMIHEPIFPLGFNIGDIMDPYYLERKHFFSRPAPETGDFGAEIPFGIGPIVAATIGRVIKPKKLMHREFYEGDTVQGDSEVSAVRPPSYKESRGMMLGKTFSPRSTAGKAAFMGTNVYSGTKMYGQQIADRVLDNFESALGLLGFAQNTVRNSLVPSNTVTPTLETAGRIASQSRSYYDMNLGGLGLLCLPFDGKVLTPNKLVNISDIKVNDMVYDKQYNIQKVTKLFRRICTENELMYTLTIGASKINVECTENHPIAIYRKLPCHNNKIRPCIPDTKVHCKVCTKKDRTINWEWIPVKKVNINDYAVMPLPTTDIKSTIIDLTKYSDYNYSNKYIYTRASNGYIKAIELLENNNTLTRKQLREFVNDKDAKEALNSIRKNKNIIRYDKHINITNDLSWLLGWWMAEGSSNIKNGEIRFTLNINEYDIAIKLGNIYKSIFNNNYLIYKYPETHTCVLIYKNKPFALYLKSFGNSHTKKMNNLINLPKEQLKYFIKGLVTGDGWINHSLQKGGYTSASSRLTRDLWLSLYRLGINSTINVDYLEIPKNSKYPNGTKRKPTRRSYLSFTKTGYTNYVNVILNNNKDKDISTGKTFTRNNYLFIKINNIDKINCSGTQVYDIEVDNTHSFIGNYLLLHNSELPRRFIEKPDWRKYGINPIPNLMPNWLPEQFLTGDPYSSIIKGELRLPGAAYQKVKSDLQLDSPGRASMLGAPVQHSVQYFTGLMPPTLKEQYDILEKGTLYHEKIQDWLSSEGLLIQAEALVFDAKNNISGHVDAVISDGTGGRGRKALEIKTINSVGLEKLKGAKYKHVGQLNFYMDQLKLKKGAILYVDRENPSNFKMFELAFNQTRLDRDIENLNKARSVAAQMLAKNQTGDAYGYSYSWIDRLNILSDVAPTSNEFKEAKFIVEKQIKNGMVNDKQLAKYHKALKHRKATMRRFELYPMRFKGKVMSPDSEYNIQSINENIKAAAEYSLPERAIGSLYESFTNLNIPLVNKFFAFKDPLEHYKQYQLYGQEYTPWTDPYGSFIAPQARTMMSMENPIQGALSWGLGLPYLLGGRSGGIYGAVAGGAYGAVHGMVRKSSGTANMPEHVEKERQINTYFDKLKYARNIRMASLSEGLGRERYKNQARATLASINEQGGTYTDMFRGVSSQEKPYLGGWLNENDPERREDIVRYAPENLGHALRSFWHNRDSKTSTMNFNEGTSSDMAGPHRKMPYTMNELDPSIELEDIKLKTIQEQALNVHDFGLGWQKQMIRVQNNLDNIQASDINANARNIKNVTDVGSIKSTLYDVLNKISQNNRVQIFINQHSDGNNKLSITIQRGKLESLRNAINNRRKYL